MRASGWLLVATALAVLVLCTSSTQVSATRVNVLRSEHRDGFDYKNVLNAGKDLFRGKTFRLIKSALKDKFFEVKEKALEKLREIGNTCPNLGVKEMSGSAQAQCTSDRVLESNRKGKEEWKYKPRSHTMGPEFWSDAARMSKLSRYVYSNVAEEKRSDVQIMKFFDESKTGGDAFVSVRNKRYIPPYAGKSSSSSSTNDIDMSPFPVRFDEWRKYHEAEKSRYDMRNYDGKNYHVGSYKFAFSPEAIEVVVRGSQSKLDWFMDALYKQKKFEIPNWSEKDTDFGYIHTGFMTQFNGLKDDIKAVVCNFEEEINLKKTKLYFTGHSLGGSVAQLLALYTTSMCKLKVKPEVFTFGAPRVGSAQFAKAVKERLIHYRFKFMSDVVAELPLNKMGQYGYEHGDTYAIGLGVFPDYSGDAKKKYVVGAKQPYKAFCIDECTPMATV